jgi:protein SCO1/2
MPQLSSPKLSSRAKLSRDMLSSRAKRGICFLFSATMTACGHAASLPFYQTAEMTPEWLAESAPTHRVAPFRLQDQRDSTITNAQFAGRVTIVHFFFTRCGDVCPTTTTNVARTLRAIADDRLQVLSHSVTPDADSVASLRHYAETHQIVDPRWHLLTGARADVEALARRSYFVRLGRDSTYGVASIAHTESVLLVDGAGRLRGVYAGTLALEMDRLREDARTLLAEATR